MRPRAIRPLLWKELRQLGRNRTAMIAASALPFLILFVAPIQLLVSVKLGGQSIRRLENSPLPGFAGTDPTQVVVQFFYPLLLVLGGLMLPSLMTTYAVVAERERKSLELLVSLPVTVGEIIAAKLLGVLVVTAIIGVPYVAMVITLLLVLGVADASVVPALVAPFLAAVACSTGISLLLTLLARDFRTSNNLNGLFFVPAMLLTLVTLGGVGGPGRVYVLTAVLLVLAAATILAALRWVSFERYLE